MKNVEITEEEIGSVAIGLCPFGSLDIEEAIKMFKLVGLSIDDLIEEVHNFIDSNDGDIIDDVDICYVAYEYILQEARNTINDVFNFDIVNDINEGTEFYTYGNAIATSYDYSTKAQNQLVQVLKHAKKEELETIVNDDCTRVFLEYVDIDINDILLDH